LLWAHAASVGEQQVLEPVLSRIRRARPDVRIVQTHTSPSVVTTPPPAAVCRRDYLPWDEPASIAGTMDALAPALLLFGRGDLWPELVASAAARGVPVAVAGATVRADSARLRTPVRLVLHNAYRPVSWLGAATAADAERWSRLGVPVARIVVTGDPRHDRILERTADLGPGAAVRAWAGDAPVLVAGSVEPGDDGVLAAAIGTLVRAAADIRVVVVPHDVSAKRLATCRSALEARSIATLAWEGPPGVIPEGHVAIVAAWGLLTDLYLGADLAYVGGGFRRGGLHAVAEPAAVGLPVIVGPRWQGAADADAMVSHGGAVPLPPGDAAAALARIVSELAAAPAERARRGLAARATLAGGASRATADAVLALLVGRPPTMNG
jgi:3-deoxy-D-manno-octulosonic-acid transferase